MRIIDCFSKSKPVFSFEFFPPKTPAGLEKLYATIDHLAELHPDFVSVTYGAGGSSRDTSVEVASHIKNKIGLEAMAHLTCVGHERNEVAEILRRLEDVGVENILALRGDPPKGDDGFKAPENGFAFASELASFVNATGKFCIGGACYPEGHPENLDPESEIQHLVTKVNAGSSFLVTQLFFDNAAYFSFVDRARSHGIEVPIIPGIMPVTNVNQVERFTSMCGATIPADLLKRLDRVREDEQAVMATGIEWATHQCRELLDRGAPGIHFYTLNKSLATRVVYWSLQR